LKQAFFPLFPSNEFLDKTRKNTPKCEKTQENARTKKEKKEKKKKKNCSRT
jgi:hypothetical protein